MGQADSAAARGYAARVDAGGHISQCSVVINPGNLAEAMSLVEPEIRGQADHELIVLLLRRTTELVHWGTVPNSEVIRKELADFVRTHAEAVAQMRQGTLHDFVQRVLAAAELGRGAAEATTAVAHQLRAN